MKDVKFSSWAGQVIDNRGDSDGAKTDSSASKEIRMARPN